MTPSERNTADRPSRIPWPPILLTSVLVGAYLLGRLYPLSWPGLDDWPARAVGLGLGIAGLALLIFAVVTLRRHHTTVLPDAGATALVTAGPYRRFRNPMYLGICLMLLGLAELTKNVWFVIGAAVFALLVTLLAILPEERHLERRFGAAYLDYKARSRRWL